VLLETSVAYRRRSRNDVYGRPDAKLIASRVAAATDVSGAPHTGTGNTLMRAFFAAAENLMYALSIQQQQQESHSTNDVDIVCRVTSVYKVAPFLTT